MKSQPHTAACPRNPHTVTKKATTRPGETTAVATGVTMTVSRGKRRRTDRAESPDGGAEGAAAASRTALSAAVRASLAEATAAAALAASARAEAAEMMARSMAACQAAESAAAQAVASASALARELGIQADDGGAVAARGVESSETASEAKGAVGDGNGDGCVAAQRSESAGASAAGRVDGGGNGGVTVFHLPDAIIEKIFDLLGGAPVVEQQRYFPCSPALARFALSCRRFARLFRGSYVTNIQFDAVFRFAKNARDYQEIVRGALSRFSNACSVTVMDFECFPETEEFSGCDAVVLDDDDTYILNVSRELDFRIAAADRSSLSEAVAGRIGHLDGGAKVKKLLFGVMNGVAQADLTSGDIWMKAEHAGWLDYLPNVTIVVFEDCRTFRNSSQCCGTRRASLKELVIDLDSFFGSGDPWDAYLLEFLHFRNLETLVLSLYDSASQLEVLKLPKVLELLPKLNDFGIHLMYVGNLVENEQLTHEPLLNSLFCNPSLPVEGRCKLRVHVGVRRVGDFAKPREVNNLEEVRKYVAGDALPEWDVAKLPESNILLRSMIPSLYRFGLVVLATFRPAPFTSTSK